MAKQNALSKRWIIGAIVAAAVVAVYFGWASSYLGARLAGPDAATLFTPFVRHLLKSQNHCYDNGSDFCEKYVDIGGQKEFTVAYLFREKPRSLEAIGIYGCFDTKNQSYLITFGSARDCQNRKLPYLFFGYTAKTDNFENAIELFRCYSRSANNVVVTDDRRECELTGHTDSIQSLGWAAAAGHLPQRRLEGMCLAAKQAGVLAAAQDGYCRNLSSGEGESAGTPPAQATVFWQNPKNRFDVNNDGSVTNIDILNLINTYNSKGVRDLVKVNEPAGPPFIDVNGDKFFNGTDWLMVGDCVNKGGKNC